MVSDLPLHALAVDTICSICTLICSAIVFSLKDEDLHKSRDKRSRLYLGKLRGIPSCTIAGNSVCEYILYDSGSIEHGDYSNSNDVHQGDAVSELVEETDGDDGGLKGEDNETLYRRELAGEK
jgi:hypothetical protein